MGHKVMWPLPSSRYAAGHSGCPVTITADLAPEFLTLCAAGWGHIFGTVTRDAMKLNAWGVIVREAWLRTPSARSSVMVDAFVIMPNHFHAILWLTEKRDRPASAEARFGSSGQVHFCARRPVQGLRAAAGESTPRHARCCGVAEQLLRTHHPYRRRAESDAPQYRGESFSLAGDPYGHPRARQTFL